MSNERVSKTLESIGGCLMGAAFLALPILLLVAIFKSIGWIAEVLLPISGWVTLIALLLVPIFLLAAIPRAIRGWAGLGILLSSYAVGISLWLWSLVIAYAMAGVFWIIVGLFFAGIGVVAVAGIASALHGEWLIFIQIVVGVVIVYGLRVLGNYLIEKSEPKAEYRPSPPSPPAFDEEDSVKKGRTDDFLAYGEHSEPRMSEEEAVDIAVDFGTAYADCNDEGLIFKPISRLPSDVDTVVQAMKVSYQMGFPLPNPLESSYKFCYPQIGFFVSDEDFERVQAYFGRLNSALLSDKYHPAHWDHSNAISNLNSAPSIAALREPIDGQSITGADLIENMDDFFKHEFLAKAPEDIDREWVRRLAKTCWLKMISLIADWEAFRGLVRTGDSGLEPKEAALLRMNIHKKEREIDALIDSQADPAGRSGA
jgi:hypothetical protein